MTASDLDMVAKTTNPFDTSYPEALTPSHADASYPPSTTRDLLDSPVESFSGRVTEPIVPPDEGYAWIFLAAAFMIVCRNRVICRLAIKLMS